MDETCASMRYFQRREKEDIFFIEVFAHLL